MYPYFFISSNNLIFYAVLTFVKVLHGFRQQMVPSLGRSEAEVVVVEEEFSFS